MPVNEQPQAHKHKHKHNHRARATAADTAPATASAQCHVCLAGPIWRRESATGHVGRINFNIQCKMTQPRIIVHSIHHVRHPQQKEENTKTKASLESWIPATAETSM